MDLREDKCPDGRPRLPPVRDQGATNYCYAFSLADYHSFMACRDYSGLYAGLRSNLASPAPSSKSLTGGLLLNSGMDIDTAERLIQRNGGLCLESDFRSNRREIKTPPRLRAFLNGIWSRRQNPDALACRPRSVSDTQWTVERGRESVRNAIHASLERRVPALINFTGEIISSRRARAGRPDHVAMVVARKTVGGKCQYLIRDPTPVDDAAWPKDHGYVWVPEDVLLRHTSEAMTGQSRSAPGGPSAPETLR